MEKNNLLYRLIIENAILRNKLEEKNIPLQEKQIKGQITIDEYKKTLKKGGKKC